MSYHTITICHEEQASPFEVIAISAQVYVNFCVCSPDVFFEVLLHVSKALFTPPRSCAHSATTLVVVHSLLVLLWSPFVLQPTLVWLIQSALAV